MAHLKIIVLIINMKKRIITTETTIEDAGIEKSLRPRSLNEYIGQDKVKKNLKVFIEAALKRKGRDRDHNQKNDQCASIHFISHFSFLP